MTATRAVVVDIAKRNRMPQSTRGKVGEVCKLAEVVGGREKTRAALGKSAESGEEE